MCTSNMFPAVIKNCVKNPAGLRLEKATNSNSAKAGSSDVGAFLLGE